MKIRWNGRRLLGWIVLLAALLILYIAGFLLYGTWNDWQPEPSMPIPAEQASERDLIRDSLVSFLIWNIGYGGLGKESDFFYDSGNMFFSGGRMVRPSRKVVEKNVEGILETIGRTRSDFFLLQEVDYDSRRSYFTNEFEKIRTQLPRYYAGFAPNYKVRWVPIPVLEPWHQYGSTFSGLATYSRFQPTRSIRYQLPGSFNWPTRLFQLDRCIAVHRYEVEGAKELVVMNIHHSAYDSDGAIKRLQMEFLQELCLAEYQKGNYVVVGGDWNQVPPNFAFDQFMPGRTQGYTQLNVDPEFLPSDWLWAYDPRVPTNRKTRTPYEPGITFVTLIDYFLVSPNVRLHTVRTLDLQFRYSDHQPVWLEIELIQ